MIIDGRQIAEDILNGLGDTLRGKKLGIVAAPGNPATESYVARKAKVAERLGVEVVRGQLQDIAAMCDGVSSMLTMFHSLRAVGRWPGPPRTNLLDGGAPFYRTYECKDGGVMSIGALEPQFYAELRKLAGLTDASYDAQMDRTGWPAMHEKLTALFKTKSRDEWEALLEGSDACAAAVRGLFDAPEHPHLAARKTFVEADGFVQPAPAPRFSRTPSAIQGSPAVPPVDAADILAQWSQAAAQAR